MLSQIATWLASAAFCSGAMWQPFVNFFQSAGVDFSFNTAMVATMVGCGSMFFIGLRFGRYAPPTPRPGHSADSVNDLTGTCYEEERGARARDSNDNWGRRLGRYFMAPVTTGIPPCDYYNLKADAQVQPAFGAHMKRMQTQAQGGGAHGGERAEGRAALWTCTRSPCSCCLRRRRRLAAGISLLFELLTTSIAAQLSVAIGGATACFVGTDISYSDPSTTYGDTDANWLRVPPPAAPRPLLRTASTPLRPPHRRLPPPALARAWHTTHLKFDRRRCAAVSAVDRSGGRHVELARGCDGWLVHRARFHRRARCREPAVPQAALLGRLNGDNVCARSRRIRTPCCFEMDYPKSVVTSSAAAMAFLVSAYRSEHLTFLLTHTYPTTESNAESGGVPPHNCDRGRFSPPSSPLIPPPPRMYIVQQPSPCDSHAFTAVHRTAAV